MTIDLCIKLYKSLFFSKHIRVRALKDDPSYIAPEVHKEVYDEKSDMWTLGVILYTLLCGYTPFQGKDRTEILEKVIKGKYSINSHEWDIISDEAKDLLKRLLSYNLRSRPSAKECLQHPWLSLNQRNNFGIKRLNTIDFHYFILQSMCIIATLYTYVTTLKKYLRAVETDVPVKKKYVYSYY